MKPYSIFLFLLFTFSFIHEESYGQCGSDDFNLVNTSCLGANVNIENLSVVDKAFKWDFCEGDLSSLPNLNLFTELTGSSSPRGIEIIFDGTDYFAFITSRSNDKLFRIYFGGDLNNNNPLIEDLGNISGLLDDPEPVRLIKEQDNWYGIIHNSGNNSLIRLLFQNSLLNQPTANTIVSGIGGVNSRFDLEMNNDSLMIIMTNFSLSTISSINLGNSVINNPLPSDIVNHTVGPGLIDIEVFNHCGLWYGFAVSFTLKRTYLLSFGTSLFSAPNVTTVGANNNYGTNSPYSISLVNDEGKYIFLVMTLQGNLYKIDLGSDIINDTPIIEAQGDFGLLSNILTQDFARHESVWYGFGINFTNRQLFKYTYPDNCSASIRESNGFDPGIISYSSPGTYSIGLESIDEDGFSYFTNKSVLITSDPAPDLDISFSDNCVNIPISFTSSNSSGNLVSYLWQFGDGQTSSQQDTVYSYTVPGLYKVQNTIMDSGGCQNSISRNISIYPVPVANFNLPAGSICSNQEIQFINNSISVDSVSSWLWDFGDGQQSTDKEPSYEYSGSGNFNVSLTVTVAGCSDISSQMVNVLPGPVVDFNFENSCAQQTVQFTDNSTGADILSWDWDFGNGIVSNLQNPLVFFSDPGDFEVTLNVTNLQGCVGSTTETITIHGNPLVAFSNDLACNSEMTQFFDLTVIPNANPVAWDWDFGDGATSTLQNPLHQFTDAGDYNVKLVVTSNFGCRDSLELLISVNSAPLADFSYNTVCSGETVSFQDESDAGVGLSIVDWLWQIDGQIITEQNPEVMFNSSGDFLVELTVTSENLCTETVSQVVTINESPFVDFEALNACNDEFTTFQNLSTPGNGDNITSYLWDFDGLGSSTVESPMFVFNSPGLYQISLTVFTQNNCEVSISKMVDVGQNPSSAFIPSVSIGAPPLPVDFSNNSTDAVSYFWDFGNGNTSVELEPTEVFQTTGEFEVMLVSRNNLCTDTLIQVIRVVDPVLDVSLDALEVIENGGDIELQISMSNRGSVVIEDMDMIIDLGGKAQVSEAFAGSLAVGEELVYTLTTSPIFSQGINYVCVRLDPFSDQAEETVTNNNRDCANESDLFLQLDPFPNPAIDILTIGYVTPSSGSIELSIYDLTGKEVKNELLSVLSAGLASYSLDISTLDRGVYLVQSKFGSVTRSRKVVLN